MNQEKSEKITSGSDQVRLRKNYKLMLQKLCEADHRSMANMLEVLIDQELKRRNIQP